MCANARINQDNKARCLGYFTTKEEAHQAYLDAKKIYHKIRLNNELEI